MELKEQISLWVEEHRDELLRDIGRLCAIRSVRGEPAPDAPFGAGPRRALSEALALCGEYGFKTGIYGGAVGSADINDLPAAVDILGHLDVVGEGDCWDTDPYTCVLKDDGCFYGRGTDDDKGAVVMALFAMRCVTELGLPLRAGCRLIMGTDEESGSNDLPYYYNDHAPAPGTFTPDAGFPLYNVEKGRYAPELSAPWEPETASPRVLAFNGGFRVNVIPSDASAEILGVSAADAEKLLGGPAAAMGVTLTVTERADGCLLHVHGVQAHAASPEDGVNGLTALLELVCALPLADCASTRALSALHTLFPHGDWLGKACGIAQRDEVSGDTTLSFTVLSSGEKGVSGLFDSRVAVCATEETVRLPLERQLRAAGFEVRGEQSSSHHTPEEGHFVQTLLRCYETYSGRKGECLSMGGGTYVHDIEGGVAFGAGMPDFNSNLHGANERINVEDTLTGVKIFALSIAELCS